MNIFFIDKEALKKAWGADNQYWFSLVDYKIVEDIDFLSLSLSAGMDKDDILNLDEFITYYNFKRCELAKAYVETIDNSKIKSKFDNLEGEAIVEYFWKCFHVYPDLFKGIETFQNEYVLSRLKKWCEDNNINYKVEL